MKRLSWFVVFFLFSTRGLFASYEELLLEQLIMAEEGDVIEIPEGTYEISSQLSLRVSGVTLKGQGKDKSILSFKGQKSGAEGLYVSADHVTLEDFAILDTGGDAIKAINSKNLIFRNLKVGWTGELSSNNGGYGFYPVKTENILIEGCEAFGASDSGIYVGQSKNIIVRKNYVHHNVSGIEIENSQNADVYENIAENNTSGILVFNLPGLSLYGEHTRVFHNYIRSNNTKNFSSPGNIIAYVPQGTGVMVMANKKVEVFSNTIMDHQTVSFLAVSYYVLQEEGELPEGYDPLPKEVFFRDNIVGKSGYEPIGGSSEMSQQQIELLAELLEVPFPSLVYDGVGSVEDEKHMNTNKICFKKDQHTSFVSLDLENGLSTLSRDISDYECELEPLSPVNLEF